MSKISQRPFESLYVMLILVGLAMIFKVTVTNFVVGQFQAITQELTNVTQMPQF